MNPFYEDSTGNKIYNGDALAVLKTLPDESVQMCMTSPPYWGLRNYAGGADIVWPDGWRGQLGLEPTPELYCEHLMMIFHEVKRVLRKDGSFYLNIGDTYVSGKGSCFNPGGGDKSWQSWVDRRVNYPTGRDAPNRMYKGIPPKCMTCIPERVVFAMLDDGFFVNFGAVGAYYSHLCPSSSHVSNRLLGT